MTRPERLREQWGYEEHTPRCSNCIGFRKARITHDDRGAVIAQRAQCSKGRFEIVPNACCDKWSSRDGERLT